MGRARDLANILSSSGNVALDSELGLSLITPTSIAATGGSGSISATGAVSFTSASAISFNGCFTSTYQNYSIIVNYDSASATGYQLFRLRANGTDNSTSNYYSSGLYNVSSLATPSGEIFSGTGATIKYMESTANDSFTKIDISNPQLTKKTVYSSINVRYSSVSVNYTNMGAFNGTTPFDGITFYPSSGTITGTIKIYGYRN
jgi:hypothetical protein